MKDLDEHVRNDAIWLTATPSPFMKNLPFYIAEAGHFVAQEGYLVERNTHDSYLLLYTLRGEGTIKSMEQTLTVSPNQVVLIDCHHYHAYYTSHSLWDFFWVHINGSAVSTFYQIIYPNTPFVLHPQSPETFMSYCEQLLSMTTDGSIVSATTLSCILHAMLNELIACALQKEQQLQKHSYHADLQAVLSFIHTHYAQPITIEDMITPIHISKYHFIRIFKRSMGVTPYHYLNTCRINHAKLLLRTTTLPIASIAEACGFLDPSNFIAQFKKLTNQKPTEYRRDFR